MAIETPKLSNATVVKSGVTLGFFSASILDENLARTYAMVTTENPRTYAMVTTQIVARFLDGRNMIWCRHR
jgi:hypothetical protein